MKTNYLLGILLVVLIASCLQFYNKESQTGVYKLDKQVTNDGVKIYTHLASEGTTQYKIYTPTEYFYIANGQDSSVGFGLGTYTKKDGKIEESNIYNVNSLDTTSTFHLDIAITKNGFTQVIPDILVNGIKYKLTEDYTTLESKGSSALDGLWHQTKNIEINGNDSVDRTYNEYKIFHAGHFMWGARYLSDSLNNKYEKIVGHGTFSLKGDALVEDLDMSSRQEIIGKYNIIVKFNGTNEFTQQTADTSTHIVGFKTYQRVIK